MAIDVRPVCSNDGEGCFIEVEQTIDMVLDIERSKRPRGETTPDRRVKTLVLSSTDDPIPRPVPNEALACDTSKAYHSYGDSCYPMQRPSMPSFTLEEVFGKPLKGACSVAGNSSGGMETVCLEVPRSRGVNVRSQAEYNERWIDEQKRCYSIAGLSSNHSHTVRR